MASCVPNWELNKEVIDVAKLTANCMMMGVSDNSYLDKKTNQKVVQHQAQLFFTDDKTMLPVGIDRTNAQLLAELQKAEMVQGVATVSIREYKGTRFLDLVGFDRKK